MLQIKQLPCIKQYVLGYLSNPEHGCTWPGSCNCTDSI